MATFVTFWNPLGWSYISLHLIPCLRFHPMPMLSQPKQRAVDFPLFQPLLGAKDHWDWDKRSPQNRSFKHPSSLAPIKLLGIYQIYINFEDVCGLVGLVALNKENKMMQDFSCFLWYFLDAPICRDASWKLEGAKIGTTAFFDHCLLLEESAGFQSNILQ